MTITIRQKLYGLGLLGLLFSVAIGFTGWNGIRQVGRGVQDVGATSSAIRNHMEASTFLDLTRADVSKIFNATGDAQDTAVSEFEDHQKLFHERLAVAISFNHSSQLSAALKKESDLSDDYLGKATKITSLRKNIAIAMPLLGGFLQEYQDLRNIMDDLNDKLEAESKRSQTDAARVVQRSEIAIVAMCIVCSVLLFAIAFQTARGINQRLTVITGWLKELASGDLTLQAEDPRRDELGEIAHWFRDSLEKLRVAIGRVAASANSVTAATEEMTGVSQRMSSNAEETTKQANVVTAATEEMSASLREIGANVGKAASVAQEAVGVATSTNQMVSKLGDSSAEIGQVIKVITSIAQQTNLLALNATIEAARAGEAGKGFAVVANEVKELAKQTAKATEDIRSKIEAIQADTKGSVQAISTISTIINQVNDFSSAISRSVDEQNTTTGDIAMNISEGAKVSTEIAQNISGVAQAALGTSTGAHELTSAAQKLERLSSELRSLVGQFKYSVN